MSGKLLRAYAVTEHNDSTGGIVFAKHAIVARRKGANAYADGDFSYVSCRRASWADRFAETGTVPASVMVEHGWHFECADCGRRIDEDLPHLWESEVGCDEPLRGANLRYARWKPSQVIGTQHSLVFCRRTCERSFKKEQAEKKRIGDRAIGRFERTIMRRFPGAAIVNDKGSLRPHVYVTRNREGKLVVEQIIVSFTFPGQQIAPACLRMEMETDWTQHPPVTRRKKPYLSVCVGDREAFEAYAAETKRRVA